MQPHRSTAFHQSLSRERIYQLALSGIVVLGLLVRLHQVGADDPWIDEAFTGFLALTPEWLSYLRIDNTPPLYYLIMRLWCGAAECGPAGLRLPSVAAGVVFVALAGLFVRRAFGRRAALLIALLAALSPIHVYYSQEARVYAMLLAALLLFLYLQWRVVHGRPATVHYILLLVAGTCALYLHYLSLIAIGAYACVYLVEKAAGWRDVPRGYFLAVAGALALFVPWILLGLLGGGSTSDELGWIAGYFADRPLWQLPARTFTAFLTGPALHFNEVNLFLKRYQEMNIPAFVYPANALLTFLFLCVFIAALAASGRLPGRRRTALLEASAFMILPLAGLMAASLLVAPVYVAGRYDLIAFPGFLLVGGAVAGIAFAGDGPFARPGVRAVLAALVVLLAGAQAYRIAAHRMTAPHAESIRTDTMAAVEHLADGDGLLVASHQAALVWYQLHAMGFERRGSRCSGGGRRFACRLFPPDMERAPASLERFTGLKDDPAPAFETGYFVDELAAGAKIVLLLDDAGLEDGRIGVDRIGAGVAKSLLSEGYSVTGVVGDYNLLILTGRGKGEGTAAQPSE